MPPFAAHPTTFCMLFWLKKALTLPFLPLHFALLAGLTGTLLLFTRHQKLARSLLVAAIAVLTIFSNQGVATALIGSLETRFSPLPPATTLPAPAAACRTVVVLGGGHADAPALSPSSRLSSSALIRLSEGLRLALLLPDSTLIVSGWNGTKRETHAAVLEQAALSLGFPAARITRLDTPRDTHDEALQLAALLRDRPFLLVTSAWHMPRAMALCQKAGLRPVAAPADYLLKPGPPTALPFLTWNLGALERSTKAIHEHLGLFWSRLRGQT